MIRTRSLDELCIDKEPIEIKFNLFVDEEEKLTKKEGTDFMEVSPEHCSDRWFIVKRIPAGQLKTEIEKMDESDNYDIPDELFSVDNLTPNSDCYELNVNMRGNTNYNLDTHVVKEPDGDYRFFLIPNQVF